MSHRCHWYAAPYLCQAYRIGSLVVNLAIELGLSQRPMNMTQHDMIMNSSFSLHQTNETASTNFWSYEARRALAGAYTVSTL